MELSQKQYEQQKLEIREQRHQKLLEKLGEEKLELAVCLLRTATALEASAVGLLRQVASALELNEEDASQLLEDCVTGGPDNGQLKECEVEEHLEFYV